MTVKMAAMVAGFLTLGATQSMAWGDMYMGDGTNNPNSGKVFPYPAATNYCPSGLQPVMAGGVICCGVPNTTEYYYNAPGGQTRKVYRTRAYAPVGEKGVVYK